MAAEVGAAYVTLLPSARGFGAATERELNRANAGIAKAGTKGGEQFAKGFVPGVRGITAAIGGLAGLAVVKVVKDAISAASDLAETQSKVNVVFGESAKTITAFGEDSASALGQSTQQAEEAAATFGNLFVAMKIGQPQAAKMSTTIVQLASDLASFNNTNPADALEALRAGLVGETEPLRRFGINLNDAALRQEAVRLGLERNTKSVLPAAVRAQAAYSLILQQSTTAQGDFQRTSGGLANQQRILSAQMENLQASLGKALLPAMTKLATIGNAVLTLFLDLPQPVQTTVVAIGALSIAVGLLLPRLLATKVALAELVGGARGAKGGVSGVGAAGGFAAFGIGKFAGALGVALTALTLINAQTHVFDGVSDGVKELTTDSDALTHTLVTSIPSVQTFGERFLKAQENVAHGLIGSKSATDAARESLAQYDTFLAALAKTHLPAASMAWDRIVAVGTKAGATIEDLRAQFPELVAALGAGKAATDAQTGAVDDQTRSYVDLTRQLTGYIGRLEGGKRAAIAARQAHRDATAAIKELGTSSKQSGEDVDKAMLSILESADAARDGVQGAANKSVAYRNELVRLRTGVQRGSPLRKALDDYIAKLGKIPATVNTQITLTLAIQTLTRAVAAGLAAARTSHAAPGRQVLDEGGWVTGAKGAPKLAVVHGGEFVLSNDMLSGMAASGSGGPMPAGNTYNIYRNDYAEIATAIEQLDRRRALLVGGRFR